MAITQPDILEHENKDKYAIVDINDVRGLIIIEQLSDLINVPLDKRKIGGIASVKNDTIYQYQGVSLDDSDWTNNINWKSSLSGIGVDNLVRFFMNITDIEELNQDYKFVFCVETGHVYKYIVSASSYTVDNFFILNTLDGGDTRFVSLFYLFNKTNHAQTITLDGTTQIYNIEHNLLFKFVTVSAFDSDGYSIDVNYICVDEYNCQIIIDPPIPVSYEIKIIVMQ